MTENWWTQVNGRQLAQGDLIPDCHLPVFTGVGTASGASQEEVNRARLIVITQSCDLENNKVSFVALCQIHQLDEFERMNPGFTKKGVWETVRKGKVEALHMLASPEDPSKNRKALVVDFGQVVSLPVTYLQEHAESLEHRWRLRSPFLEHFSQAFARFFMRVGLPSAIEPFK